MVRRPGPDARRARSDADALVELYTERYRDDLMGLPDDLLGLVDYVNRKSAQRLAKLASRRPPARQRRQRQCTPDELFPDERNVRDFTPLLIGILDHLRDDLDRLRLAVIRNAQGARMTPTELRGPLGHRHRQAVGQEVARLEAARAGKSKDVGAATRAARAARVQREQTATVEDAVVAVSRDLVALEDMYPAELTEYVDVAEELADRLPGGDYHSVDGLVKLLRVVVRTLTGLQVDPPLRAAADQAAEVLARIDGASAAAVSPS